MTGLKIKLGIAAIFLLAAHVIDAQVFVKVKPTRPAVVIAKPSKAKQGHIWVDGHWQWSKSYCCQRVHVTDEYLCVGMWHLRLI